MKHKQNKFETLKTLKKLNVNQINKSLIKQMLLIFSAVLIIKLVIPYVIFNLLNKFLTKLSLYVIDNGIKKSNNL